MESAEENEDAPGTPKRISDGSDKVKRTPPVIDSPPQPVRLKNNKSDDAAHTEEEAFVTKVNQVPVRK